MRYIGIDCHKKYDHATMIDTETGERLIEFKDSGLWAWSSDDQTFMGGVRDKLAYSVISFLDGSSTEYDLSEYLPEGDRFLLDWSPKGDQIAFSFRFRQFDAYIMRDVIHVKKR